MRRVETAIVLGLALLTACGGTETGNPPGSASVAFAVRASEPAVVDVGSEAMGTRVEALLIAVARAELAPCTAAEAAVTVVGEPSVFDLARGSGQYPVPAGEYCGVRIVLTTLDLPGGRDFPPVANASVAAHGVRADGVPFTAASAEARTVVADGVPFTLAPGTHAIFAFDASRWLGALLDGAPIVDGRATIDGSGSLGDRFDRQLSGALFEDRSGDGIIGPDETTPVVATPAWGSAPP